MTYTATERSKASRLRRLKAAGTCGEGDLAWLAEYERTTSRRGPKGMRDWSAKDDFVPAQAPVAAPKQTSDQPSTVYQIKPSAEYVPINPWTPSASAEPEKAAEPSCSIPDCPACRNARGPAVCGATGRRVWPPMSDAGARAMAGIVLLVVGMAVKIFRQDKQLIVPTSDERAQLGSALREMALRRASWIGAIDDILAVAASLTSYTRRAVTTPIKALPENGSDTNEK